jgi:hypothetical protein
VSHDPAQRIASRETPIRIASDQVHADGTEIVGNIRGDLRWGRRIDLVLSPELLIERTLEGDASCQRLIQRDADAVPVAGLGGAGAGDILRRNVGRRAGELIAAAALFRNHISDQTKVENDDASFR